MRAVSMAFVADLLWTAGCAHYPVNALLAQYNPDTGFRFKTLSKTDDGLFVVLAFFGGGHRAAALSYGVLEALVAGGARSHSADTVGAHGKGSVEPAFVAYGGS